MRHIFKIAMTAAFTGFAFTAAHAEELALAYYAALRAAAGNPDIDVAVAKNIPAWSRRWRREVAR
jgi:hypothetical protein